jgi:hypothetical protein
MKTSYRSSDWPLQEGKGMLLQWQVNKRADTLLKGIVGGEVFFSFPVGRSKPQF